MSKLIFQALDWDYFHDEDENGIRKFYIRMFGMTKERKTVYLQVEDFRPYFYFEIKKEWRRSHIEKLLEEVKKKVQWQITERNAKGSVDGLHNYVQEEKHKMYGFTNYKKFNFVKLIFEDYESMRLYAKVLGFTYKIPTLDRYPIKLKLYESNILPVIRFMHLQQLEATGWMQVSTDKLKEFDENDVQPTCCDINYRTSWKNVTKVEDRLIEKFIICSYDIECKSIDGSFPQFKRDGDKIIQIGLTLSRFGEDECYYKHLLSLKKTADIEGATVESFETEEELLLAFTRTIRKLNPDIITGYNIFGFDFNYMMERAKKLKILSKFCRLSRVTNETSDWIVKDLSSAALGKNILTYYKMTGRVIIDLMKVVQRDHKLSSYKLDYVASFFIREKIEKIEHLSNNQFKIKTKKTDGIYLNQYIVVAYEESGNENRYNQGEKFQVVELGKDYLIVNGKINTNEFMDKGLKVFWCQAKDDLPPSKIFELCDGTPEDRAIVGKYCLMDCALCNKLMAKLQIVANNASMAIVCNVPLSYLFLRGQGVKIFSLVSKQCAEENHLLPFIEKKQKKKTDGDVNPDMPKTKTKTKTETEMEKILRLEAENEKKWEKHVEKLNFAGGADGFDEDDEDEGYEGAIVFIPDAEVHYEPIPVLDYASLYPNSMILRNLSHEMFVNDPQYDNLPGYRYHEIKYKNNDGSITVCRFAEKLDGTKGIIPRILMGLLAARKKYKKMMEEETDPFKKEILNCLQNAYKVTANSLYGQTGASTSDICMKEIAASTTATGREMLLFSKYFIENYYSEMINLALSGDKQKYMERCCEIYKYYPTKFTVPDRSYDEKEKKMFAITHDVHVATDENLEIPESKFIAKEIEYDVDIPWYDNPKQKKVGLFSRFQEFFKTIGYATLEDYTNKFVKVLCATKVVERRSFCDDLRKLLENSKYMFYEKQKDMLGKLGYMTKDNYMKVFKKELLKLEESKRNEFFDILYDNVHNIGFNGKSELFEKFYETINDVLMGYTCKPEIIYGDTDSVFFKMAITDRETKEILKNKIALGMCINMGIWASIMISTMLPSPMAQAYEKVLWPFVIQGKKRYVGNLYEKNINEFKQKSMGIELKRRDNAPIVKIVCSGIIDQILNHQSSEGACMLTKEILHKIITGKYEMDKFIITKTLKGNALTSIIPIDEKGKSGKSERQLEDEKDPNERSYKDRTRIVHAVLADRMADRDPGNKPMSNDRIPYMYIEIDEHADENDKDPLRKPIKEPELQGDRVEAPDFIIKNNLKVDYLFYITNQIMKPALKFLELIAKNPEDIFNEFIIKEQNRKSQMMPIGHWIKPEHRDITVDDDANFEYVDFGASEDSKSVKSKTKSKKEKTAKKEIDTRSIFENINELMNNNITKTKKKSTKKGSKKSSKIFEPFVDLSEMMNDFK